MQVLRFFFLTTKVVPYAFYLISKVLHWPWIKSSSLKYPMPFFSLGLKEVLTSISWSGFLSGGHSASLNFCKDINIHLLLCLERQNYLLKRWPQFPLSRGPPICLIVEGQKKTSMRYKAQGQNHGMAQAKEEFITSRAQLLSENKVPSLWLCHSLRQPS